MFVVVGVTGGIAAYKTVHLVRLLVLNGHDVHVIPTEDALRFVGLPTWEAVSRNPVTTSVHDDVAKVRHVSLGQAADLVVIAPATANFLAKMTAGLADDLLGTSLLATTAPVVVAPAMHTEMWRHPATVHNMAVLASRGVHVVGPEDGPLTGGDVGPGRMSEPEIIVDRALEIALAAAREDGADADARPFVDGPVAGADDLAGLRVVVTAGGTREPLDPVRFIGNRSSGRQGVALALAAADRGAEVTLIAAHVDADALAPASGHARIAVSRAGTALDLQDAVTAAAASADVVVMAAAVADYRPAVVSDVKLTKEGSDGTLTLELVENPDIVAGLAASRPAGQTIVAFAAETAADAAERLERGRRKRDRKGVDLLVLNEVGWAVGFESAENSATIIGGGDAGALDRRDSRDRGGDAGGSDAVIAETAGSKRLVADAVWDAVRDTRASGTA